MLNSRRNLQPRIIALVAEVGEERVAAVEIGFGVAGDEVLVEGEARLVGVGGAVDKVTDAFGRGVGRTPRIVPLLMAEIAGIEVGAVLVGRNQRGEKRIADESFVENANERFQLVGRSVHYAVADANAGNRKGHMERRCEERRIRATNRKGEQERDDRLLFF